MTSSLSLDLSLSRPAVLPGVAEAEPLYVLLRARCSHGPPAHRRDPDSRSPAPVDIRPPIHLALLLDASGSMHRIVLEGREREHWQRIGEERGDLKRGRVDGREGWLWSGQTLAELQARHRTPMQAALRALLRAGDRLRANDGLAVVAFADRAQCLVAADAVDRAEQIEAAAALLSRGVEASGLGDGTRLAEGLRLALASPVAGRESSAGQRGADAPAASGPTPDAASLTPTRLLLVSDGLLEDRLACGAWVERIAEAGIPLSCIGVGDQFDEEWLMWAADMTRGSFRYAPTADALEVAVAEEMARLETLAARRLIFRLRPGEQTLFRDLCQVSPDLSALHRMETDGTAYRFSLGDLSEGQEAIFLAELSVAALPRGSHPVLAAELTGESTAGEPLAARAVEATLLATPDLSRAAVVAEDHEIIAAAHAYRAERRAQRALRRGHRVEATRHLRDTRQIVEGMGRPELAADLEAQAAAVEAGGRLSQEQEKRIKAATRHLMRG